MKIIYNCLLILALLGFSSICYAKTTYIPSYRGYISITKGGHTTSAFDSLREVSLGYDNGHVVFTLLHEEVTKSKVKSIKRAKMNAGWSSVGWGLAMGLSNSDSQHMINYLEAKEDLKERESQINYLQTLSIGLLIENNTDQTIFVSDMANGTASWYIAPNSYITLNVSNPGNVQYRVSNVYILNPVANDFIEETAYVTVEAQSKVEKTVVDFEDDDCWVICVQNPNVGINTPDELYYKYIHRLDKETFHWSMLTFADYDLLINKKKEAEKREKQERKVKSE